MRRTFLFAVALTMAIGAGGCATAINMQDATLRKPYGGFTLPVTDFFGGETTSEYVALLYWPIWLVDKPLCLVGDTLTLPYIFWVQRNTWLPQQRPNAEPGGQSPSPSGAIPLSTRREYQG